MVVVLFFLQNRPSPVIPNLQDIGRLREMCPSISTVTTVVDGYSVEFCDDLPNLRDAIMPVSRSTPFAIFL